MRRATTGSTAGAGKTGSGAATGATTSTRVPATTGYLNHLYNGPPITVLYHELAHVYDYVHGTTAGGVHDGPDNAGAENAERVAVGLPIDDDNDASAPDRLDPRHLYDYTENALRDEMGAPRAPEY